MANQPIIAPELLRQLIRYEPKSGKYFWNSRPLGMFNSERAWKSWNTSFANKETLIAVDGRGYCQVVILTRHYNAHRIIWLYHYGEWPNGEVDHINGVKTDNRVENLRVVTSSENSKNTPLRSDNTSGITGVSWNKANSTWRAKIQIAGKTLCLGSFATISDAAAARQAASKKHGFHQNHGRY